MFTRLNDLRHKCFGQLTMNKMHSRDVQDLLIDSVIGLLLPTKSCMPH